MLRYYRSFKRNAGDVHGRSADAYLKQILLILERAHPAPKTDIPARIVETVHNVAKYVGLPALLIGAILPAYDLLASAIEYQNSRYIKSTYIEYASQLSEQHQFDRALRVLSQLDKISSLDPKAQYAAARISEEAAYYQGKSYDEVEDAVKILLALNDKNPWYFPHLGGINEIIELEARLVDIHLKRAMFAEALSMVSIIRKKHPEVPTSIDARLTIQEAK